MKLKTEKKRPTSTSAMSSITSNYSKSLDKPTFFNLINVNKNVGQLISFARKPMN